jgi:hypothetical protein
MLAYKKHQNMRVILADLFVSQMTQITEKA